MSSVIRVAAVAGLAAFAGASLAQPSPPGGGMPADQFLPPSMDPGHASPPAPQLSPTRDVTIHYGSGKAEDSTTTEYVSAEQHRKRLNKGASYWIINTEARTVAVMIPQSRVKYLTSGTREMSALFPPGSPFKREGEERIADLPCTDWLMTAPDGYRARTCYTGDGVLLSADDGLKKMEATSVVYGKLDPALFTLPSDWRSIQLPPITPMRDVKFKARTILAAVPSAGLAATPPMESVQHFSFPLSRLRSDIDDGFTVTGLNTSDSVKVNTRLKTYQADSFADKVTVGWSYGWPLSLAQRGATFVRGPAATVAGVPCTKWTITQPSDLDLDVCIADDGLMLRSSSSERTFEMVNINIGPQPLSLFFIPEGFAVSPPVAR